MKEYNKLVRDFIPEIIENNNQKCKINILSDNDFLFFAEKKLDEEVMEYHQDQTAEELVDLIEIIYAIANAKSISETQLNKLRIEKQKERGAFKKKILLVSVE